MRVVQEQKGKLLGASSFLSMRLFTQRPDSHLVLLNQILSSGDNYAWMI